MWMRFLCCFFIAVCSAKAESIKTMYLEVDEDLLAHIYKNYSQDEYIPVTFTYEGKTWSEVSMRIRGDGSREFGKKSLKLRFDDEPFANGRDRLNINAEYLDMSIVHAVVSSELYREAGIPCFTAEHVLVYLNGDFWGVYVLTENMDEKYLAANGLDPQGLLYKASRDGSCMNVYEDVTKLWEIKNNVDAGWKPLQRFIHELNHVPDDQFVAWLQENVDLDNYYSTIIMNALLGSGSTYYHNYFVYNDIYGSGKWKLLPWDLDQTLGTYHFMNYPITRSSNEYNFDNPWAERAWIHPETRAELTKRLHELGQNVFTPENVFPRLDSLQTLLHPWVLIDQTDQVETSEKFIKESAFNYKVVEQRYQQMVEQLEKWPTPFAIHRTPFEVVANQDFVLSWNESSSPDGDLSYEIRVGEDRRFRDPNTIVLETTATQTVVSGLEAGTYFWSVYAVNKHGRTLGFSKPERISIVEATAFPMVGDQTILFSSESPYVLYEPTVVEEHQTLTIEPGVKVLMGKDAQLKIQGAIYAKGTASDTIVFTQAYSQNNHGHGGVVIETSESVIAYCVFEGATSVSKTIPALSASRPIAVKNCLFQRNDRDIVLTGSSEYASTFVECRFIQHRTSSEARVVAPNVEFDRCVIDLFTYMNGAPFVEAEFAQIQEADVYGGDSYLFGAETLVARVMSSDIHALESVFHPENESTEIAYSTVSGGGVVLHNVGSVDHVTLWHNELDLLVDAEARGMTQVSNTILERIDVNNDGVEFSYCLAPKEAPFQGMVQGDPYFVDPELENFFIHEGSAAIDAGDPNDERDADGSITDIGARWYDKRTAGIVINELNYRSSDLAPIGDWVELHNPTKDTVDVGGWKLTDNDEGYTFPANYRLAPHAYVVVAREPNSFAMFFGGGLPMVGPMNFGLSGQGETVYLKNQTGIIIDSVAYDDNKPWPEKPDGEGPSLELIHPALDNNRPYSWQQSVYDWGTPGQPNSVSITDYHVYNTNIHAYPNPASVGQTIGIEMNDDLRGVQRAYISDVAGSIRKTLTPSSQLRSSELTFSTNGFAPGVYVVVIVTEAQTVTIPFVLL